MEKESGPLITSLGRRTAAVLMAVLALAALGVVPVAASFTTAFINAGGGAYTDTLGNAWSADTNFTGGGTFASAAAIAGTADPVLYQSERTGQSGAGFSYSVPATDGAYTITLKFAELYWSAAGQRVFSVTMNGSPLLTNFDILTKTAPNTALDKSFVVNVTGGSINLVFSSTKDNANLNALEIAAGGTPLAAPTVASVTPGSGTPSGGTSINVGGTGFAVGAALTVGGAPATGVTVISPTSITATTPAGAAGPANVTVINPDEQRATLPGGFFYVQPFTPIRVNAGGGAYTDSSSNLWSADAGFSGGGTFATGSAISGTSDPTLYQSERTAQFGGSFTYSFTVPNAAYAVTLKFAEIYWTSPGSRVFNVVVNGQAVLSNFDILSQTAPKTALDKVFQVNVTTGAIAIVFSSVKDNAKVSAIQIAAGGNGPAPSISSISPTTGSTGGGTQLTINGANFMSGPVITVGGTSVSAITSFSPTSIGVTTPAHAAGAADVTVTNGDGQSVTLTGAYTYVAAPFSFIRVNAGGGAYTDTSGNTWSADTAFSGGGTYSTTSTIAGTTDPTLYQTERTAQNSGSFTYTFAVPNGIYMLTLKFAEIYWTTSGNRIFNVSLNGQQLLTNFDILTQTAPKTALDKTFVVNVKTGSIGLSFTSIKDNAKVSAIQILNGTDTAPAVTSVAPANGQVGVPTSSAFGVGFSEPMDRPSTQASFSTSPGLTGSFSWNSDGTAMTFTPSPALAPSTTYSATMGTGATDLAGTPLATATTWSFTTGTQVAPSGYFSWGNQSPSPIMRLESQGIASNGKLYVFGGFINTALQATVRSDLYDPATDTWTRIADMPEALTHSAVVTSGQSIWVIGGLVGTNPGPSTNHVWKYDIPSNTWSAAPSLPIDRGAGAAAILGTDIHFFGGASRAAGTSPLIDHADHFALSISGGTSWTTLASIPNGRNHLAGTVLAGKIYAIGGQHGLNEASGQQSEVDVYDPATHSWTLSTPLPAGRGHINSSTFVFENRIFVMGGSVQGGSNGFPSADVLAYDPQANSWVKLTSLPGPRKSPVADLFNGKIVITTGNSNTGGGVTPTNTTWSGSLTNVWEGGATVPVSLGEVSSGIIGNTIYVVGQGSSATLAYNLNTGTWLGTAIYAVRPFVGNHEAAEVINGKLYLIGGLTSGQGMVQIFNPATNTWSLGANMPYAGGSVATCLIGGKIYAAGGIVGSATVNQAAKYDPVTNAWTAIASMPMGVNHAAAATDGTRCFVFGGRGGGNVPSNGFNYVQIYDPATDHWVSSTDPGSTIAPLPQARGGMGKGVYFNGEFYVIGGETANGTGATANLVYNRVDIYNPVTNAWRLGAQMPTARHGIFPVEAAGRIFVADGGVHNGNSSSTVLEIFDAVLNTPTVVPAVFSVTPGTGSKSGGTSVTITGTNLSGVTAVRFGGVAATSFTVNSANSITATTPVFSTVSTVDVTVISAAGASAPNAVDQFGYGP
jgi:N-acetylneuraminic acid mutarotase